MSAPHREPGRWRVCAHCLGLGRLVYGSLFVKCGHCGGRGSVTEPASAVAR